jgi:CRP-like cAMP-binding protein
MSPPPTPLPAFLRTSLWAEDIGPKTLARVESEVIERSVPAGGSVCRKGGPVDYWVGVIEGLVKISSVSAEGKPITFTGIRAGGWFGEGSMLRAIPWGYDAVALRDCRVALMPRATFYWLLETSIEFNRFLLEQLNERLSLFIGMLESDRLLEPEARVARCLASLFNPHLYPGGGRDLQISQEEIGYLSGVSRQRVNQALQVLDRAGLLRVAYGGVTVLDLAGLGRYDA